MPASRRVRVPADLAGALEEAGLSDRFAGVSFTHRREYVTWVDEAKKPQTRRGSARPSNGRRADSRGPVRR
jgi:uncharacterized protein YdeI (YjbR/CyaY-like superfamily)